MRILVESGNYFADNDNVGDRAIYMGIARRLRRLWPQSELRWLTRDAGLLRAACPGVSPLELEADRLPLEHEPAPVDSLFSRLARAGRRPARHDGYGAAPGADARQVLAALRECDLVLATGGGYFCDSFARHAWTVLDTLEAGARLGRPAAVLGCGLEPLRDRALSAKMLAVLPRLSLIACREPLQSPAVARSFGAHAQCVSLVGDDAIEQAFGLRPPALGTALGVSLRQADYAGVDAEAIERLRGCLAQAAGRLGVPLLAVPISLRGPSDAETIEVLLSGIPQAADGGERLGSPEDVMRQAGRCRLVVTGSYHAAVFALAQGASVVGLVASSHYRAKLRGLQAQFGGGCRVVALDRGDTAATLAAAIEAGWSEAERVRPELLESAQRQMAASAAAYERVGELPLRARARPRRGATGALGEAQRGERPMAQPVLERGSMPVLTASEIEAFREQGFVGPFTAFEASAMEQVRRTLEQRVLGTPTPHCPFGLRVRHLDSRTVYALCSAPAIVGRMQSLFGPDLVLWNSNLFDKPPAEPGRLEEYPWHQDLYNWNMEPVLNVSAWLAIGPSTPENGCVEVIPGSHRQIIPPVRDTDPRLSLRFGGVASDPSYVDETKKLPLPLAPGQFFLFNERLLHHSGPNRTRERRLGLAIRVTVPLAKVSEPFPCVLLSGTDRMGFNRYVDPPEAEPDAEWLASLPPGHVFAFDRPIPGLGWHLRESDGLQRFAWTGLEPDAWIDFRPVGAGDHLLRCEVAHVLVPRTLGSLRLLVNGEQVAFEQRRTGGQVLLEARVPERVLQARGDRVRVALAGQRLSRPCDLDPSSPDKRTLGVGVRRIALLPAGEGLPAGRGGER